MFGDDSSLGYWRTVNNITENEAYTCMLDVSSKIIGQYPDKKAYTEMLTNLMVLQEGDLAEQVKSQSRFDNLKTGGNN